MATATRAWTSPANRPGAAVPFAPKLPAVAGFSASQSLGAFLSTLGLGDCPSRPERVMVIGGQDRVEKNHFALSIARRDVHERVHTPCGRRRGARPRPLRRGDRRLGPEQFE